MKLSITVLLTIIFTIFDSYAQSSPPQSQRILNGFLLGQYDNSIPPEFGKPVQEFTHDDGWVDRAYWLNEADGTYMVFGFPKSVNTFASIQITGSTAPQMVPFLGLQIGDSRKKVIETIGHPDDVESIDEPRVYVLHYKDRNYSFEIDEQEKLFSIKIVGEKGFPPFAESEPFDLHRFFVTLHEANPEHILELLAADIKIFRGDSVASFARSALEDIQNPDSRVSQELYSSNGSLTRIDTTLLSEVEMNIRLMVDPNRMAMVYKFPESATVREIVTIYQAGKWRVWEIYFRQ